MKASFICGNFNRKLLKIDSNNRSNIFFNLLVSCVVFFQLHGMHAQFKTGCHIVLFSFLRQVFQTIQFWNTLSISCYGRPTITIYIQQCLNQWQLYSESANKDDLPDHMHIHVHNLSRLQRSKIFISWSWQKVRMIL